MIGLAALIACAPVGVGLVIGWALHADHLRRRGWRGLNLDDQRELACNHGHVRQVP